MSGKWKQEMVPTWQFPAPEFACLENVLFGAQTPSFQATASAIIRVPRVHLRCSPREGGGSPHPACAYQSLFAILSAATLVGLLLHRDRMLF